MWEKARKETIKNSYKNNTKLFFEKANETKNEFRLRTTIMRDEEGMWITDKEDATSKFKKVFEKMLNITTQIEPEDNNIVTVELQLEEPSFEEVKMAIKRPKREVKGQERTQ